MARTKNGPNGRLDKLDEAIRTLVQTQASFVQNQAAFQAELRDLQRQNAERFARIESLLLEHSRILAEHGRIMQALPDAIRDKIGFQARQSS